MIYINWPTNAHIGVVLYKDLTDFHNFEAAIFEENVDEFEVEGFLSHMVMNKLPLMDSIKSCFNLNNNILEKI